MRRLLIVVCATGFVFDLESQGVSRAPNVVFRLADDLGWADVAPNNPSTFYETPSLARLAAEGVNFTQAYAACPVCSPTRASLMTGKHPARLRAWREGIGARMPSRAR